MKKIIVLLVFASVISCAPKSNMEQEREKLFQTDIAFSERSVIVGNHQAFLEFASPDVVLLKPDSYPIVGKRELRELYSELSDSNYRLTWKPSFGRVSESCDLGYTFGIYLLEITEGENKGQVNQGTYCTIWEKNVKNEWRFVLDTGNSGLEPEKSEQ